MVNHRVSSTTDYNAMYKVGTNKVCVNYALKITIVINAIKKINRLTALVYMNIGMVDRPRRDAGTTESAASLFANSDSQLANQRPMYCKDKVYTGGREYSLEELRAWNWQAKRRDRQQREAQFNEMRSNIMYVDF